MKAKRLYIDSLDGIRAISFLIVFISHAGLGYIVPGGLGVTIFFFLSGYLITTLLRQELEASGRIDLKQFYLRRVLRIFPPFYTALLAATLLAATWVLPGEFSWRALLSQAFYANNYYIVATHSYNGFPLGTAIYWSLAVEEHFYAVFPFLFWLLWRTVSRPAARAAWLLGACGLILLWRCILVWVFHSPELRTYVATDTRIDSILYGCALATYCNPALETAPRTARSARVTAIAVAAGGALMLVSLLVRAPQFRDSLRYTLQGLALLPLFYGAVRYPMWPIFRLLNTKVLRFLGVLSYSLYLVHFIVVALLSEYVSYKMPILLGVGLPVSVGLAYLMHIAVEKPAARLKARFSSSAT